MSFYWFSPRKWVLFGLVAIFISLLIYGCGVKDSPPVPSVTVSYTPAPIPTQTATQALSPTPKPSASSTLAPTWTSTPTPTFTPEPLTVFTSTVLREGILPSTYITESCKFLSLRWSSDGSPPGTSVAVIMFHSILKPGRTVSDDTSITEEQFQDFIQYAHSLGFQTITTLQLNDFLLQNTRIPPRSMVMIIDDRRVGTVESYFMPVLELYNWTVTMGWNIDDTDAALWKRVEVLFATGRVDIQSHGYWHRYLVETTPEEDVRQEIFGPIPVMQEQIGQRPTSFIWPGGNFTPLSVQIAHEAGYNLGFTAFSRGPIQFNWIPLGEKERLIQDPLMVLPRFWDTALGVNLDITVRAAEQARQFAIQNYEQEARIYRNSCGGELPALEDVFP